MCIIARGVANGRNFIFPTDFVLRAFVRAASAVVFRSFRAAHVRQFMLVHGAFIHDMSGTLSRALSWIWLRSTH